MLIGCTLPVVSLCTLLGGLDPDALVGAYAVTVGVAFLGCSLALTLSIWARKAHEVLLTTYLIWCAWLLAGPVIDLYHGAVPASAFIPSWLGETDPFTVAFDRVFRPSSAPSWGGWAFLAACLLVSAAMLSLAVVRVRPVAARQSGGTTARARRGWAVSRRLGERWDRVASRLPSPTLDGNPVLWHEWHRNRPSRWSRRIWRVYIAGAIAFSLFAMCKDAGATSLGTGRTSLWVNGLQVAVGILLLSVGASTSMAEERARGSLDVLLTTPLSTRSIVLGKWLGTFRKVPWLAVLPGAVASALAASSERWAEVFFMVVLILLYGAFVTSLGLALATWIPRPGRALAVCVATVVVITVGTFFLIELFLSHRGVYEEMHCFSPFSGPAILTATVGSQFRELVNFFWPITSIIVYILGTTGLLLATLRTFDRCLGRASGRRPPAPLAPAWKGRAEGPRPGPAAGPARSPSPRR